MEFVRGQIYRRPDQDETWCAQALGEIARTLLHPIRIAVQIGDGTSHVGHLEKVEGGLVTLDIPRENQAVTIPGDKVIAFYLVPESPSDTSDEIRGIPG